MMENLHYISVHPVKQVSNEYLAGKYTFTISLGENTYIKNIKDSVFILRGKSPQLTRGADTEANPDFLTVNQGFQQNICGALFNAVEMKINDKPLQKITDFKTYLAIKQIVDNEHNENNPIILSAGNFATDTLNGTGNLHVVPYMYIDIIPLSGELVTRVITETNLNTHKTNSILCHNSFVLDYAAPIPANTPVSMSFRFPFMDSSDEITPGSTIEISFDTSTTIALDMFIGFAAEQNMLFTDFVWMIPVYKNKMKLNKQVDLYFKGVETHRLSIGNNSRFKIMTRSDLTKISICLMNKPKIYVQSNIPVYPTTEMTSLQIQYNYKSYPETPMMLNRTNSINNWYDAYVNFKLHSKNDSIKDFQTFLYHPIFVFTVYNMHDKIKQVPLEIHFDVGNLPDHELCIYLEYNTGLTIKYNNSGLILN